MGNFHNLAGCIWNGMLLDINTSPISIIKGDNSLGDSGDTGDAFYLLGFNYLYRILRNNAIVVAAVAILFLLVAMLYVDRKAAAEHKADIQHILLILFLICSSVSVFGMMKSFFDAVFY